MREPFSFTNAGSNTKGNAKKSMPDMVGTNWVGKDIRKEPGPVWEF